MKLLKLSMAAILALGFGNAYAFHSGGVAECEGCHTMHEPKSSDGFLLAGSDQSSTCLNCHQNPADTGPASYHVSTSLTADENNATGVIPLQRTPGGDFGWVKKSYRWSPRAGTNETSPGERHGHNIVASDYGYVADTTLTTAPGGTYDASKLACSSCHDPHGKWRRTVTEVTDPATQWATTGAPIGNSGSYNNSRDPANGLAVGAFRILGGKGYAPQSYNAGAFANQVPNAVAPSAYNRTEATTQTRVAYGSGMSEWCANCHSSFKTETTGMGTLKHPAGNAAKLGATILANYNSYVKSGDLTGQVTSAYLSLVPFEEGSGNYTTLKTHAVNNDTQLAGADAQSNVACISCHRAHASGFDHMLRFDYGNEFMTVADATGAAQYGDPTANPAQAAGRSVAERTAAYYDRPASKFAPYQRVLCNKCHAKD
jgi:predicted CXXCH cytochrome family protein